MSSAKQLKKQGNGKGKRKADEMEPQQASQQPSIDKKAKTSIINGASSSSSSSSFSSSSSIFTQEERERKEKQWKLGLERVREHSQKLERQHGIPILHRYKDCTYPETQEELDSFWPSPPMSLAGLEAEAEEEYDTFDWDNDNCEDRTIRDQVKRITRENFDDPRIRRGPTGDSKDSLVNDYRFFINSLLREISDAQQTIAMLAANKKLDHATRCHLVRMGKLLQ